MIATFILVFSMGFGSIYLFYPDKEAQTTTLNVYEKILLKKHVNYLIIGDSIGRGAGAENPSRTWFKQWEDLMKQKYGVDFQRSSVVQSGATAFEGLYLFKNQVNIPRTVDLVIFIFGENDRKYMSAKQFSFFYESLLREVKIMYPDAELMTITENSLNNEFFAKTIERISSHYHSNHIDMRTAFQISGQTTTELTSDLIHPNGFGYQVYADSILNAIEKAISTNKQISILPQPLFANKYVNVEVMEIHQFREKNGPFLKLQGFHSTQDKDASITYSFTGTNVGVKVLKSEEGGELDVFVDNEFVRRISTWWPITRERTLYLTSDLSNEEHEVTFIMTGTKSDNNKIDKPIVQISSIVLIE
jgi:lysophospholipase L1-like esterase